MGRRAILLGCIVALAGCGAGDGARPAKQPAATAAAQPQPTTAPAATATAAQPQPTTTAAAAAAAAQRIDIAVPAGLGPSARRAFVRGRTVAVQSGCLACHRIGSDGGGLGPDLNRVGRRLPAAAIRRALVIASPPMPSYRELAADKLDALVTFLSTLSAGPPAGARCRYDTDCG